MMMWTANCSCYTETARWDLQDIFYPCATWDTIEHEFRNLTLISSQTWKLVYDELVTDQNYQRTDHRRRRSDRELQQSPLTIICSLALTTTIEQKNINWSHSHVGTHPYARSVKIWSWIEKKTCKDPLDSQRCTNQIGNLADQSPKSTTNINT